MQDQIKSTVINLITNQILKYAILKAPYLGWGPMGWITTQIVSRVITKAVEFGVLELGVASMRKEVNNQVKAVRQIIQKYEGERTDEEKRILDEELKKAYDDLFKF